MIRIKNNVATTWVIKTPTSGSNKSSTVPFSIGEQPVRKNKIKKQPIAIKIAITLLNIFIYETKINKIATISE